MTKTAFLAAIISLFTFAAATAAPAERQEKRFKGVELYSWKTEAGKWHFALLDGTNRVKTVEEVKTSPDRFENLKALQVAISQLAEGEFVTWSDRLGAFDMPSKEFRAIVAKPAKQAGVTLSVDLC